MARGRAKLGMPTKKKNKEQVFMVERVWAREVQDGQMKYLVSWEGYATKSWEPIENFNGESVELVRDLERILDDPANNPKPQWLLEFEDMKARGIDVIKRTPRPDKPKPQGDRSRARSRSTEPRVDRNTRGQSEETRRSSRGRLTNEVNYADTTRRAPRTARADSAEPMMPTPARPAQARRVPAAARAPNPAQTPPRSSAESSRASTRPSDRAESEDDVRPAAAASPPPPPREDDGPSSSSMEVAEEQQQHQPLAVDVQNEMRVPLVISPPALASPNSFPAASPASTVLSMSKIDSNTGILVPIESAHEPFDWVGHIEAYRGEVAPINCFWKRRIERFHNPFGAHIGEILKVPDIDESFNNEWCTIGLVKAVHGPWVQIHVLDTDSALAHWYMADDTGLQPFVNLTDQTPPKIKLPNKRRSTGNWTKIIEKAMTAPDGTDLRVPKECFDQLPWKNRPVMNHFKVGLHLETYDPVRGEGCFYPATIVELIPVRDQVKFHFDGYPESHTKVVSFDDYRLFPCGFAAAIGWKCKLPEQMFKKAENRGRKKTSTVLVPVVASSGQPSPVQKSGSTNSTPSTSTHPPNNNNEKHLHQARKSDPVRQRPQSYKEPSTSPEGDDEDEDDEEPERYVSKNPQHRQRAPAIPGLQRKAETGGGAAAAAASTSAAAPAATGRAGMKRQEERKKEDAEEPPAKRPARQLSPLTMEDFSGQSTSRDTKPSELQPTQAKMVHTGNKVLVFLNHECSVGVHIDPNQFKQIPSKITGSLPHVWREILQQLVNSCVNAKPFIACVPKYCLSIAPVLSITYDDSVTEFAAHFIAPPPSLHQARRELQSILQQAGVCQNAVTFDSRRICEACKNKESDNRVFEILRNVGKESGRQPDQRPTSSHNSHNSHSSRSSHQVMQQAQMRQQQRQQIHQQQQQQQQLQQQRLLLSVQQPPVARIAPNGMGTHPQSVPVVAPLPPPVRVQLLPQPAARAARAAAVAAPAGALIDDPDRFLNQKVSLKALAEHEIIECLAALKVPPEICNIFKSFKINYRSLPSLKEEIMVNTMKIPPAWAKVVANFIRENQE